MKKFYLLAVIVLLISSCKKEKDNATPNSDTAVVKSISQTPGGLNTTFSYDSEGRLSTIRSSNGSGTNITYNGDTVIESMMNDSGYVYSIKTVFLNSSGIATSSLLRDTFGGILTYSQYLYDSANFKREEMNYDVYNNLVARKTWDIGANNVYYYTSTDSLVYQNNAQIGYSYSYEKENTVGNDNMGLKYYGKSSKNIEKTMHKTGVTGNVRYTFQYTFDNSGRISTKAAYNHLNELVYTNSYSYN
jgi:YD repeat-containing protein